MAYSKEFLMKAIELSAKNINKESGGPFGAVIVKNGRIISTGVNRVISENDPTAHAEIEAIRKACRKLKKFRLDNCEIYTSCEPCPMCLSAIYWARISKIYYANTRKDAGRIGFQDDNIYREISLKPSERTIPAKQYLRSKAIKIFSRWKNSQNKFYY
ncbi:MAG: nucleoside deaminase [Ignavibacteria bacterium]|nr:nucleoside deaminase [Ignavibacteria bacterium]